MNTYAAYLARRKQDLMAGRVPEGTLLTPEEWRRRQTVPRVLSDADNATLDRRLEMLRPKPLREMIVDYWQAKRRAQGDTAELPGGRVAD